MCFLFGGLQDPSWSQPVLVKMGINGLTCSACARSVEMQIRKLPFVRDVVMDIAGTEASVLIAPDRSFLPEKLMKAVYKAGFSVRDFRVRMNASEFRVISSNRLEWAGSEYIILSGHLPDGRQGSEARIIARKYLPESERKEILDSYSIDPQNRKSKFILFL